MFPLPLKVPVKVGMADGGRISMRHGPVAQISKPVDSSPPQSSGRIPS
jgi:hypothetical protein